MEKSPNGSPIIPPKVVPWLVGIFGLAATGVATLPPHTVAFKVCVGLNSLGVLLGLASPGLRR